jgi:hypothetical protein
VPRSSRRIRSAQLSNLHTVRRTALKSYFAAVAIISSDSTAATVSIGLRNRPVLRTTISVASIACIRVQALTLVSNLRFGLLQLRQDSCWGQVPRDFDCFGSGTRNHQKGPTRHKGLKSSPSVSTGVWLASPKRTGAPAAFRRDKGR